MTAELKPCPFCGGDKNTICKTDYDGRDSYAVSCRYPECHGAIFTLGYGYFADEAEAIAAWNTRALPAVTVGVKQLREAFNAGCDYGWDQAKHDERGGPELLTFDEAFSAFLAALEPVTAPDPAAIC